METYFQGSDGEKHKKKKKDKAMADLGTPRERPRVSGRGSFPHKTSFVA